MNTQTPAVFEPNGLAHEALTMALGILTERIRSLPKEDKNDLYDLMKEIARAEDQGDLESIVLSIREILDQSPISAQKLEQVDDNPVDDSLLGWVEFVSGKIRDERKLKGLTQGELSERSGLPQSHISRLENGQHSPSRVTLEKIAKALDVPLQVFDPSA